MKKILYILLFFPYVSLFASPIAPINIFRPYDILLLPAVHKNDICSLSIGYEGSTKVRGFQEVWVGETFSTEKVNPLQIYQSKQDALASLKGFPAETNEGQLAQLFNMDDDNNTHGLYIPCGDFKVNANAMFAFRYYLPHDLILGVFLPYMEMELSNVTITQVQNDQTFEAQIPQGRDLLQQIEQIGCLSFNGWKRKGIGDLTVQGMWLRDFPQAKPWLRNVRLNAQLGLIFPTGKRTNINELLAIPFGNDGAWGFMVGFGIDLYFLQYFHFGANVDFTPLFGNTACRRIRTDKTQTDLFFVNEARTYKHYGSTNYMQLWASATNFCRGLELKLAYTFMQHDRDRLYLYNDGLSSAIANGAESLQDFTNHSLMFFLNYDTQYDIPNSYVRPYISLFYKVGFEGRRSLVADTAGLVFTMAF